MVGLDQLTDIVIVAQHKNVFAFAMEPGKPFALALPKVPGHLPRLYIFRCEEYLLVKFAVKQRARHFNGSCICQFNQSPGFLFKHVQSKYGSVYLDEKIALVCFEQKTPVDVTAIHSFILVYECGGRKKISKSLL